MDDVEEGVPVHKLKDRADLHEMWALRGVGGQTVDFDVHASAWIFLHAVALFLGPLTAAMATKDEKRR